MLSSAHAASRDYQIDLSHNANGLYIAHITPPSCAVGGPFGSVLVTSLPSCSVAF